MASIETTTCGEWYNFDKKDGITNKVPVGCKGDESICACKNGQCVCKACPKSASKPESEKRGKTTCGCGGDESKCSKCDGSSCVCADCPKNKNA